MSLPIPTEDPPPYQPARDVLFEQERSLASEHGEESTLMAHNDGPGTSNRLSISSEEDSVDSLEHDIEFEQDEQELRREMEHFEIAEPDRDSMRRSIYSRVTVVSQRLARNVNDKLISPVQHILIDPVAQIWHSVNAKFDRVLSRMGNPLMFKRLFYLFIVSVIIFIAISAGFVPVEGGGDLEFSTQFHNQEAVRRKIDELVDREQLIHRSQYFSSMAHMAGTSGDLAIKNYIRDSFLAYGIRPIQDQSLEAFMTFPNNTEDSMVLRFVDGTKDGYRAPLKEANAYDDPTPAKTQPRPFLGLSASGKVESAPLVYVNYGTMEDFDKLSQMGISVKDCVVVMKYGKMETGLKILMAEQLGALGAVTFNGASVNDEKGTHLPYGGVERDSVGITALTPGDILTPGWSITMSNRVLDYSLVQNIPKIPSIPISWNDLKPFLDALKGHGKKVDEWKEDNLQLDEWWTGDSSSPKVELQNYPITVDRHELWNVLAKIPGSEDGKHAIVLGAHRDSFCFGNVGSASGTVILMEVAKVLSTLAREHAWQPLRPIYFASWDGGEENFIGSTEWVERNLEELRKDGLIYINLDNAVGGTDLSVSGNPVLVSALNEILGVVSSPEDFNKTMLDVWNYQKNFKPLKSSGDFMAFQYLVGTPSIDIRFENSAERGGTSSTPLHSCFDTYEWQIRHGDSNFDYHRTLTLIVSYMITTFADEPTIPYDFTVLSDMVAKYVVDLKRYAEYVDESHPLNFERLYKSVLSIDSVGSSYNEWRLNWHTAVAESGESPLVSLHRFNWNNRVAMMDKFFMDMNGMPRRNWFKHVIFGPQVWHPTEGDFEWSTFPGVRDMIQKHEWDLAQKEIDRAATVIELAVERFSDS